MKLFPPIFITVVISQVDASTLFGRMTIGRPRRPSSVPDFTNPPCSTPSMLQPDRSSDCLLCHSSPCTTSLAAQQQPLKKCPPCVSPPCPPCPNQNDAMTPSVEPGPATAGQTLKELGTEEPLSGGCTSLEMEMAMEELVHKIAAILPAMCFMRKLSLLPPFHLIDIACVLRGAGVLPFIRHHHLELIGYLRRHSFLSEEGFLDRGEDNNAVVIPYSSRSLCRRHLLDQAESSPGLQNNQEQRSTPRSEDSSAHQPATEIPRR